MEKEQLGTRVEAPLGQRLRVYAAVAATLSADDAGSLRCRLAQQRVIEARTGGGR